MEQDRLWQGGPIFYYDKALFPPTTDTFLLGAFPALRPGMEVCDLGAGSGLLGLLLLSREPELRLHNVELNPAALALAERTAAENGLEVEQHLADLRRLEGILPAGRFDLVVSNPPYFAVGSGALAQLPARTAARADETCTLVELCRAAARLLRWGGRFALVFRPERLVDLLTELHVDGLEPKRLRMVCHQPGHSPSMVLVEARRGGKSGLQVDPALFLRREDGGETEEIQKIYFRHRR